MREGGLAAQVFGLWTFPYPERGCARSVHGQLDALDRAVDKHPDEIERCLSGDDVRRAHRAGKVAALAGIEGGQALEGSLDSLADFAARGVRTLGLVHFSVNAIATPAYGVGARAERGLTDFGRDVIAEMNRLGMIVDLAHINRTGFFEALLASSDPSWSPPRRGRRARPLRTSTTNSCGLGERWSARHLFEHRYLGGRP